MDGQSSVVEAVTFENMYFALLGAAEDFRIAKNPDIRKSIHCLGSHTHTHPSCANRGNLLSVGRGNSSGYKGILSNSNNEKLGNSCTIKMMHAGGGGGEG